MGAKRSALAAARGAAASITIAAVLAGCGDGGSGGGDASVPPREVVLFDGPAAGLLPHEEGRTAEFRATATAGGESTTASFTTRVVVDDGRSFVVEQRSGSGGWTRLHAVDDGSEIRIETVEDDETGTRALAPPAVLVRTPVVAGETIRGGFHRSLPVVLRTADGEVRTTVPFEGTSERTALGFDEAPVDGRVHPGAIRWALLASGRASVPTPVGTIALRLEIAGEETLAPGVGLVHEEIDLVLRAGSGSASAHLSTVRVAGP
ncbi:hypothetical protein KGQ64_17650 [bacterium]|nr:hypothetical protein [bacterium]